MADNSKKRIVTIGGGTGTFVSLSGLKKYADTIDITAIVSVADDGGSTGRLMDQFGKLPVGDVRMALAALAAGDTEPNIVRELMLYRFDRGEEGLKGHNLGNLFLVALTDMFGSEARAIEEATKILNIRGRVVPVSETHARLVAQYADGSTTHGEAAIDKHPGEQTRGVITDIFLDSSTPAYTSALSAINEADLVLLGPGDLYTSIIPNFLFEGVSEALQKTDAQVAYVANLMTKCGQTDDMSVTDHVDTLTRYTGRKPDTVVINNAEPAKDVIAAYKKARECLVHDDYTEHALRIPMLAPAPKQHATDAVRRSLVRHDSHTLAKAVISLLL
ncbi:MAG: uridine diphosphate-N-acetylglucosamine-binding protein YvcK [Patescibacteria group bacterium UBA2163]